MEVAVSELVCYRRHIIVPNLSFGFLNYEADMVYIDDKNRLSEVEIKVTLSDLKADFKKPKHLKPNKNVGRLIYAIPVEMLDKALEIIPNKYGIITVEGWVKHEGWNPVYLAKWHRQIQHRKDVVPLTDKQVINIARLGCMRIWSLKFKNNIRRQSK